MGGEKEIRQASTSRYSYEGNKNHSDILKFIKDEVFMFWIKSVLWYFLQPQNFKYYSSTELKLNIWLLAGA